MFQLLASTAMGSINTAAKPYGDYAVAAMGAVTRIMTVVTYVVFGFLKGFQPFAGYNYGGKKYERLKKSIRLCMIWSTVFCASLYLAIGKSLVGSVLSLGRQGIFFFPLVFVLPNLMGLTGVVWVQPMADLLTAILTIVFAVRINHALSTEIEMGED